LARGIRADQLLVDCGLADSVDHARRLVMAGKVHVEGRRVDKPGEQLDSGAALRVKRQKRFVSRGGEKLDGALDALGIDVSGRRCLDAGCSTGGFTDCLLQRGACHVVAVDVGYGDFDWKLRNDPRVSLRERTNIRSVCSADLGEAPDLVTADLSFIRLATVLPVLVGLAAPAGELILLVKPQFELPRELVADGVVRDEALHLQAVASVERAAEAAGARPLARSRSVLEGPEGNAEFFVQLRLDSS
jgi:23S rRNA (cytidine1920-2'-O)/16S rRNA (cytidine1409-2'-O)-methyltransferase